MTDTPDYLAWRAFYLGLRVANSDAMSNDDLAAFVRQLNEIAAGEATLHNSAAENPNIPGLENFLVGSTNQVIHADQDLSQAILRGFAAATDVPE